MSHAYDFWLFSLKAKLIHPDAALCTAPPPDETLQVFFNAGFSTRRIAMLLNRRWEDGFLERKRARKGRRL